MRTKPLVHAWIVLAGASLLGCGGPEIPRRDCATVIWAEPSVSDDIRVEGSWDGWAESQPFEQRDDGWFLLPLDLSPGEYGYRIVRDGKRRLDPLNPLTTWHGEEEVSLAIAEDCGAPSIRVDAVDVSGDEITVSGSFLASEEGPALDIASLRAEHRDGVLLPWDAKEADGRFTFVVRGLPRGKHTFTLRAADQSGHEASPRIAVAWIDPAQASWQEGLLYHLVIDRYRGDGGAALAPLPDDKSGSRAGGTLDGVRAELERGTFDELGVTALWISPVYTNPIEAREGRGDGRPYEGYHGYWPLDSRGVEPRLGGEDALHALVEEAHRRGIRVIFDIVPNHVYEQNERYVAHRNDGWFHDGLDKCVCGNPGCGWSEKLPTCWFTSYLPDVRFEHPDAMRAEVDDAVFWMREFDADGVRIDAVPMMPRAATRRIVHAFKELEAGEEALFSIGEVFTGPGAGGIESIRYFLGPHTLSGAFDFPLMWKLREVFGRDVGSLSELEELLVSTDAATAGSGSALGRMIDNHDTSRFVTEITGEGANDPWYDKPPQPTDPSVYARAKMALAFVLTLHGLPVLYYGDEIALAGAGDPDSRRVMPDLSTIGPMQSEVRDLVSKLGRLRRCSSALRRGDRAPVVATRDDYAYIRDAGDDDPVLVVFSRKKTLVTIPAGAVPVGDWVDFVTGETLGISAGGSVPLENLSFRVLLRAGSPCLNLPP